MEMTGVPILDTIIYITWGATLMGVMAYTILKIFGKNGDSQKTFGRREGDMEDLKMQQENHGGAIADLDKRVAVCEERDRSFQAEMREFKEQSETARQEQRDNTIAIHRKLDRLIERG